MAAAVIKATEAPATAKIPTTIQSPASICPLNIQTCDQNEDLSGLGAATDGLILIELTLLKLELI